MDEVVGDVGGDRLSGTQILPVQSQAIEPIAGLWLLDLLETPGVRRALVFGEVRLSSRPKQRGVIEEQELRGHRSPRSGHGPNE
jgi:hypothetical protein